MFANVLKNKEEKKQYAAQLSDLIFVEVVGTLSARMKGKDCQVRDGGEREGRKKREREGNLGYLKSENVVYVYFKID